jgi:hypothetical protein
MTKMNTPLEACKLPNLIEISEGIVSRLQMFTLTSLFYFFGLSGTQQAPNPPHVYVFQSAFYWDLIDVSYFSGVNIQNSELRFF